MGGTLFVVNEGTEGRGSSKFGKSNSPTQGTSKLGEYMLGVTLRLPLRVVANPCLKSSFDDV
jgi:hypothetical protein